MTRLAIVVLVLGCLAACGGAARAPVERPAAVGINAAETYDEKLGAALAKQWRAGELRLRESNRYTVEGQLDDAAKAFLAALDGRAVELAITDDWGDAVSIELPNEALPFVLAQTWVSHVEIDPSHAHAWSPQPIDLSTVPGDVQTKLDPMLKSMLATAAHEYSFSGTLTIAGCIDDARRAELRRVGIESGYARGDAACTQSVISFIAPVVVAATVAALPWVLALAVEPRSEPDRG